MRPKMPTNKAKVEHRWQVLDGRFHPSEEGKGGWNIAWQGKSRYEAERVVEVRAETP